MLHFIQIVERSKQKDTALLRLIKAGEHRYLSLEEALMLVSILVEYNTREPWRNLIQRVCDDLYKIHGENVLHKVESNDLGKGLEGPSVPNRAICHQS